MEILLVICMLLSCRYTFPLTAGSFVLESTVVMSQNCGRGWKWVEL